MIWILGGLGYAAAYAAAAVLLRDAPAARLWVGNLGLLVSPLVTVTVIVRTRRQWRGRHLVFFDAIAVGAGLWFAGQVAWVVQEAVLGGPQPWLNWDIVPQLCGALMPLLALVAAPHRGVRRYTATTAALDIYGLMFVVGFLCWVLVIAPGLDPGRAVLGLQWVSVLGPLVRAAALVGLLAGVYAARATPWAAVYRWLAAGIAVSFAFLVFVSADVIAGSYRTGSIVDVGWILPFWFFAAAAEAAPASNLEPRLSIMHDERPGPPLLLFCAIFILPTTTLLVRALMPLGPSAAAAREVGEDLALLGGIALVVLRVAVEQRVVGRYERRLRLLATACEQAGELIVVTRGNRVEYANRAFCDGLGYTLPEIIALDRAALVAEDSDREVLERLRAGEAAQGTVVMKRRDGTTFSAAISAAPIVDRDREGPHFVAVVRDLTDEVQTREKLVRSERLSAIGELVSSIAHQINNPLQSVIGTIDVLLATPSAEAFRPDLERVRLEAWRAGHTIRNLLTFARKSPGPRQLDEINDLLDATLALCAYDLQASHVRVTKEYGSDLPLVLINREEMQQVVLNLIANAQQSLGRTSGGTLTLRTYLLGSDAVVEVADDGPGVPPELARRIFEPFVTTRPLTDGTGLGLSTAFGIVVAHGGALELVQASAGACFRMTLRGAGFAGPVVHSV